ncbi:MAG: phosphotransferase family protein [Bryobacteraceae bacterium]|nr:phosphotransferase family protein [Bryobacteraceae bacterium]
MPETIRVRAGEELPEAALSAYLSQELPGFAGPLTVEQFAGGHSNLTYLIKTPAAEYVLRRAPLGPVPPKAHDMAREFRLLGALSPVFPKAPRVLHCCTDDAVLGATFYLMERRRGRNFREASQILEDGQSMSEAVVDTLVELHAIDLASNGLLDLGKPAGFLERQVKGWTQRWQAARTEDLPELEAVVEYLNRSIPPEGAPCVVHNDYKLDNLLFALDAPRVEAVLDWEMTTIGDPLVDVGMSLAYWQVGGAHGTSGEGPPGWLDRAGFAARYGERTGRDLRHLPWHETLGLMKIAVILQQIYFRYVRGQTRDERFARFGESVRRLGNMAHRQMETSG